MSAVIGHEHGHRHSGDHHDEHHDHGAPSGWRRWVYATNHKDIGTMYLIFSFTMFMVGGVLALGIEHLVGTRTLLFADLGVDLRQYDDDFAHDADYDDAQALNPIGSLGVRWSPEPLSGGVARLVADVYDSVSSNSAWYYGIEVDGRLRLAETIFAFVDLGARNSIDSGADAGDDVEERLLIDLGGGVGYALRDGAACRVRIGYTISDATVDNDYERLLAAFEMGIVF